MNNLELMKKESEKIGCIIGCWSKGMNQLSKPNIQVLIEKIKYGTDIDVKLRHKNKDVVVEIAFVDNEIDFILKSYSEYLEFGDEIEEYN
ncbi:hypothetical protein [Clostridium thermobutyricum]|uniref:hypothetical protein n=1 Tax=Clostridium thermobutyricum TaxID=29372 RepID=UPI002943794A|nr:hypothetical protein [Clostridium thermobutyricum]